MANFDFWQWASPDEVNDLRALDFERQAKDSIQKADASLWARDAGQLLDQSRNQIGDMIGNTLNSVRSSVAEPVQKAVEPVQRAVQGGQQAADQFSEWAGSRLGEVRSKLPGYDALDQPSTTPARDDWRVGDQPAEPAKLPSVSPEGSGSALLDALNEHTSGGTSPAKVTAQPDSAPPKPVDQPFPPDTTVTRDDYRKEWRPQLYQETPNATPPWSGQARGTVNPGLAPLDNALRQVQDLFGGSRANPNPGQSQYNGLYTDPATYGGNAVSATPHQIGINARDHLVGVMRDYWQASGGKEPDSDQGLSSIARVLTESMAHEVAHDTDAEHSRVHAATTKQISQADGSAGYQTIYNALKQMRDAGSLSRVVDTAKAGTSPNPNEIAPPQTAAASVSPMERGGDSGSPLLDALNAHTQQDNPDQPSGLSGVPKESVTPTFTPADLETGNTQNGTVDLGDAAGKALEGAHNVVKTGVDFALGADEARAQWDKMEEIDRTAVDGGYYSAIDPRFIREHPDLASEHSQAVMAVAGNLAGNAPEMHGPVPAHLAGAGEALRNLPGVQKVGEVIGGLRDLGDQMTRGLPGGAPVASAVEADRYYHGGGSVYDKPDPRHFDEGGLFGPAYYGTDHPEVAGTGDPRRPGYAENRGQQGIWTPDNRWLADNVTDLSDKIARAEARLQEPVVPLAERRQLTASLQDYNEAIARVGPNVRAFEVPQGLNLLNADAPVPIDDLRRIAAAAPADSQLAQLVPRWEQSGAIDHIDGNTVWKTLSRDLGPRDTNQVLVSAGYDGVKYAGGKRVPMRDESGANIEHQAVAIFGDSLDKITNATSGLKGGIVAFDPSHALAGMGQGAVGGAISGGYEESQQDNPDYAKGIIGGMVMGGAARSLGRKGTRQALARAVASYGPGTDAIDRSITPTPQPGPLAQPGKIPTEVVRQLFDNAVGLREIGEKLGRPLTIGDDAYKLLRLARGSSAAADDRIETELGPALENLGKQGVGDLNRLLKSMDIVDKAASTGNPNRNFGGATLADAHTAMAELQQRLGQQGYTELEQRAQKVWDFGDQLRDRLVQAGVWSAQTAADLKAKHPHYSPIRVADWLEDKAGGKGTGASDTISNSANLLKSLTEEGTARASETPLDAYVRLAHEVERVAMKNEAGRAFVNYFHQDPTLAALVRPADRASAAFLGTGAQVADHRAPGESGFHVRVNGQELTYWMDQSLERAFNFTAPSLNHWALNLAFGLPARMLRAGATGVNVLFMLPNAMGDGFTYMVRNGGNLPKSIGSMAKGYAGAITKDADYHAMMRAGGGQAGFWDSKVGGGKQTIESMAGALSTPRQVFNWVRDVIPNVGQTVETATRLAQYKRDISEGVTPRQAALNARDVTVDFARGGELTKTLNSFIPFFNVGFQAPAQVVRALQNPETRGRALVGLGSMVIAPAILSEVYNQKDPTYADVPQTYKDRGLILMDPRGPGPVDPETGRPTPRFVQINSREWTPFVIAVRESVARAMGKEVRPWQEAAQALLKSSSPVEPGSNALFDLMPPAAKVGVEAITNYDSFRDRPIVPDSLKRLPAPQQYNAQTSETAKKLGALTGQSPLQIEHAVTGLAAGVGRQALAAGDMALKAAGQTPEPARRIAQIQLDLSKSGLDPDKRAVLEHELAAEQSKDVARKSLVRAQPVVGGLLSTMYREQGGALTDQATKATDQRIEAAKRGQTPATAEMKRLGVNLSDVSPDIGGQRLNRLQEQQYRAQALSLRERLLGDLVAQPTYQKADDATKTRLLQGAMGRASAWAGQAIVPSSDREGYEFTTKAVGQDPAKAVDGYLKAVALQEQLKQAQATRYLGVKGPSAEQLMGDVRELGAFRQALGKAKGDLEFVRKVGAARYAKADGAQVDPRYDLLRKRVEADPNYATYFGSRAVLDLGR